MKKRKRKIDPGFRYVTYDEWLNIDGKSWKVIHKSKEYKWVVEKMSNGTFGGEVKKLHII